MLLVSDYVSNLALTLIICGVGILVLPSVRTDRQPVRALVFAFLIFMSWRYIIWRATATLPDTDSLIDKVVAVLFLLLETGTIISSTLAFIILSRTIDRKQEVDRHIGWWGDKPPPVDMLIATYNEEEAILERTIAGALATTYPNARVWVLDDGRRPWLRALCERLGAHYNTRSDNKHAKAGNINAYLNQVKDDPGRPEFLVVLDADFVPHVDFVERMLALFQNPGVGLVQSPQHFFNPDPIQHNLRIGSAYPDEQRFFFDHIQPARDAWTIAFCCGTSSMMRYEGLCLIGGFPTESVTEDFLITLYMRDHGLATIYLNEPLMEGLAPEGLGEYITQRGRWCLGLIQIVRGHMGPFSRNQLRWVDRMGLVDAFLYWATTYPFRIACLIIPLLYWFCGVTVVNASVGDVLFYFTSYYAAVLIGLNWISGGLIVPVLNDVSQILGALEITKAVIIGLARPKNQKFKVTAKGGDRTKVVIQWPIMRPLLWVFVLTIAGLLFVPLTNIVFSRDPGEGKSVIMFWTFYNLIVLAAAMAVCIELPRAGLVASFMAERVTLGINGLRSVPAWLVALTATDARIRGGLRLSTNDQIIVHIQNVGPVAGAVTRLRDDGAEIALVPDESQRAAILAKLHTRAGAHGTMRTSLLRIVAGLFDRLIRGT